jgi:sec-independent protein translocase protein TatC
MPAIETRQRQSRATRLKVRDLLKSITMKNDVSPRNVPAPQTPPSSTRNEAGNENRSEAELSLIDHLRELRTRLLISIVAVVATMVFTWNFTNPIQEWFSRPIRASLKANGLADAQIVTSQFTDGFMIYFQISLVSALLISMPFVLFQLWRFIEPALTNNEKRYTGVLVPFSTLLFIAGCAMGYSLAPLFFKFFLQYNPPGTAQLFNYQDSILLLAKMMLVFGVCFQVPVVTIFLNKTGIVSRNVMIEHWRHVVIMIFIVVAIITPTWDPVTLIFASLPPCLLYVLSLWMIKWL